MDPIFKSLKIMKIDEIQHFKTCKLAYCIKDKLLPTPILKMFHSNGAKSHTYNTRYKNLPNIKKHTSAECNRSFLCKGI